jgi:hypothetical protein
MNMRPAAWACARPWRLGRALPRPPRPLMMMNFSEAKVVSPQGIRLNGSGPAIFREQSSCYSVQVPIGFLKNWRERSEADVPQVWLLRMDGTTVPQIAEPFVFSQGEWGDYARDYQFYTFPKVSVDELASVVVSCHGRLYCHEIKKSGEDASMYHPEQEPT